MHKIGIIGYGNMGQAIAHRLNEYQVFVFDKDKSKLTGAGHIHTVASLEEVLANDTEVLVLAVKPQDFSEIIEQIKHKVKEHLVISVAAGITTEYIENKLGKARVVRVMPNLPAKIGKAMSCLCAGKFVDEPGLHLAEKIFKQLGQTMIIKENLMSAATAISGSGPAYVCRFIENNGNELTGISRGKEEIFLEEFLKAAESCGFNKKQAELLVISTYQGTVEFLRQSGISAAELRMQVTSKAGTTEAALNVLSSGGSLLKAVKAAALRAEELSKRE